MSDAWGDKRQNGSLVARPVRPVPFVGQRIAFGARASLAGRGVSNSTSPAQEGSFPDQEKGLPAFILSYFSLPRASALLPSRTVVSPFPFDCYLLLLICLVLPAYLGCTDAYALLSPSSLSLSFSLSLFLLPSPSHWWGMGTQASQLEMAGGLLPGKASQDRGSSLGLQLPLRPAPVRPRFSSCLSQM